MSEKLIDRASRVEEWPAPPATVPTTMRAVRFHEFGAPEVLQVDEIPAPTAGRGEVVIRTAAVSVGRLLDLSSRAGTHPYAKIVPPHVLGAEHSGTVAAVGHGVETVVPGDHVAVLPTLACNDCTACREGSSEACPDLGVFGVSCQGAYAEFTVVPAQNVHRVPEGISPSTAAGLAQGGPVAQNQLTQAGLRPGDWVLVQGAASALGSITAALATHLGGRVIASSRSAWKRERLVELGAVAALDPTSDDFVSDVLGLTDGAGVRLAIDSLGDVEIWARTMAVLGIRGTAMTSGAFLGGRPQLDLMRLYSCSQRIIGVRTSNHASAQRLWEEVGRGFRPVVDRTFPVAQAAQAHRYLEADSNMGRIALTTGSEEDWQVTGR